MTPPQKRAYLPWAENLARVKAFHSAHGHWPRRQSSDAEEKRLGTWLSRQRDAAAGRGSVKEFKAQNRQAKLDEEIPGWNDPTYSTWDTQLEELKIFTARYRRWPKQSGDQHEQKLWKWLANQRSTAKGYGFTSETFQKHNRQSILDAALPGWDDATTTPTHNQLVTRAELAEILGYSLQSLITMMRRHPDRFPPPADTIKHGRTWMHVYDLAEALKLQPLATTAAIECLECGKHYRALGRHLQAKHHMSAEEYKERHGLARTRPLESGITRSLKSQAKHDAGPESWERLAPYNDAEYLRELAKSGVDNLRDSARNRAEVIENRKPAQAKGVPAMWQARQNALEKAAQASGYESLHDAITRTRHLTTGQAAKAIGVSPQTVAHRRKKWLT